MRGETEASAVLVADFYSFLRERYAATVVCRAACTEKERDIERYVDRLLIVLLLFVLIVAIMCKLL